MFLFIFEFEGSLNRTPFVKESSSHVDFVHQTQIEANEIQRGIKYTVGNKLGSDLARLQIVLKTVESLLAATLEILVVGIYFKTFPLHIRLHFKICK